MKITITSDDGKHIREIDTSDIDWSGHSLNRTILAHRCNAAINEIVAIELHERAPKAHPSLLEVDRGRPERGELPGDGPKPGV